MLSNKFVARSGVAELSMSLLAEIVPEKVQAMPITLESSFMQPTSYHSPSPTKKSTKIKLQGVYDTAVGYNLTRKKKLCLSAGSVSSSVKDSN